MQQDRRFYATMLGTVVTDKLIQAFPEIMDVGFTAGMELKLDKIEEAAPRLDQAAAGLLRPVPRGRRRRAGEDRARRRRAVSPYKCDKCGKPMLYRISKNGFFLACADRECRQHPAGRPAGQADAPRGPRAQVPQLRPRDDQAPRALRRVPRLLGLLGQEREGRAELLDDHQPRQGGQPAAAQGRRSRRRSRARSAAAR